MSPALPYDGEEMTMNEVWERIKRMGWKIWHKSTRRIRVLLLIIIFLCTTRSLTSDYIHHYDTYITVPKVSLQYAQQQRTPYNASKVALLIENRANPILAPLMLHFISVVPPDWRFRFMGSVESVEFLNKSVAIRSQVDAGKLDLTYIPSNMTVASQEEISRFLTTLWIYEAVLQPAEWLLVFQTDSILCANSRHNLNDFLDYDWIGAPWHPEEGFGGNGGLSVRRVSAIIDVLRSQQRADFSEAEDVWLAERLGHRPGARLANATVALTFSGEMYTGLSSHLASDRETSAYNSTLDAAEKGDLIVKGVDDWREGFYEPMGYHTGGGGTYLHSQIWGSPRLRKHIWDYCPEVKMTLAMDASKYVPGRCGAYWKRDVLGDGYHMDDTGMLDTIDLGHGTEMIDGVEYPLLPPGLLPF